MLYFRTKQAVDEALLKALLQSLKTEIPKLSKIELEYGFLVVTNSTLSFQQHQRLKELLPDIDQEGFRFKPSLYYYDFWLVPRFGTMPAQAAAVRDICLLTGLPAVTKVFACRKVKIKTHRRHGLTPEDVKTVALKMINPLEESVIYSEEALSILAASEAPQPNNIIDIQKQGVTAIHYANDLYHWGLTENHCDYLYQAFDKIKRNPTDIELIMYACLNSGPARHHYFHAHWTIAEHDRLYTLFEMLAATNHPGHSQEYFFSKPAILQPFEIEYLGVDIKNYHYVYSKQQQHLMIKTDTQNQMALISPKLGAGAASAAALRDAMAVGLGGQPQLGAVGFAVSNLNIPNFIQAWETTEKQYPPHWPDALTVLLKGVEGIAQFNNQMGIPTLSGFVRVLEIAQKMPLGLVIRGFHKPVVFNASVGSIAATQIHHKPLIEDMLVVVLGGPAYQIGVEHSQSFIEEEQQKIAKINYSYVQRFQADLQLRIQVVLQTCHGLGEKNPIISLMNVGRGGLAVAIPRMLQANQVGAHLELRKLAIQDTQMSPMEIWASEASERVVLCIERERVDELIRIANREHCPYTLLGHIVKAQELLVSDNYFHDQPVNLPLNILFDYQRDERIWAEVAISKQALFDFEKIEIHEAVKRVLQAPSVGDKTFLINLLDRSVGGLTVRDQMVGPWQLPVADVAVIANDYSGYEGKAYSVGERPHVALAHPAAAARIALGETITNLAAAPIQQLSDISIAINWQLATAFSGEDTGLYYAVASLCQEICPVLGISIVTGSEELHLRANWQAAGSLDEQSVTAPQTAIISAVAPVTDIRKVMTPALRLDLGKTKLILIDLSRRTLNLAGSVLGQVYQQTGQKPPDLDDPLILKNFFEAIQYLHEREKILAYHDRSDGGLFVTLCEMAFAARCGLDCHLDGLNENPIKSLFSEELGAVIQVHDEEATEVLALLERFSLGSCCTVIGEPNVDDKIRFYFKDKNYFSEAREILQQYWSANHYHIRQMRDGEKIAAEEYALISDQKHLGLTPKITYDADARFSEPYLKAGILPKVAILRDQGSVGYQELAAAFKAAHFEVIDLTMTDLLGEVLKLNEVMGLIIAGGYSFADSLGPAYAMSRRILSSHKVKDQFTEFFARNGTFTLGVGNGAQLLLQLKEIISGTAHWPLDFQKNISQRFESRLIQVRLLENQSPFFQGMAGAVLPVPIACYFGQMVFERGTAKKLFQQKMAVMQYVNSQHEATQYYPYNPVGSEEALAGFCNENGRVIALMVHPERVFRRECFSWRDKNWLVNSPWVKMFFNIRQFVN